MAHTAQTRNQANAGKQTGVRGRRSRLDKRGKPGALGKAVIGDGPVNQNPTPEVVRKTEQFWNDLSHEWFGTNPKSFPYNMGKWDPPTLSPPIKQSRLDKPSEKPKFIQGGWPEYAEWAEGEEQRDKHAWPSRNDQPLPLEEPLEEQKEMMGDGGWVWPKFARAQDRVIKGHRGRDIKRYAKSLVTKQSHR